MPSPAQILAQREINQQKKAVVDFYATPLLAESPHEAIGPDHLASDDWLAWSCLKVDKSVVLYDHLGGFDDQLQNPLLNRCSKDFTYYTEYILPDIVLLKYNLDIKFWAYLALTGNHVYQLHEMLPWNNLQKSFDNFLCVFARSNQLGRSLLLLDLQTRGWLTPNNFSKHFVISRYFTLRNQAVTRLGISQQIPDDFWRLLHQIDFDSSSDHVHNYQALAPVMARNFVQIVSETFAYSPVPFWTEKFLYPIIAKTLWVAHAAPGYHHYLKKYFGIKFYSCFDYSFDTIPDHTARQKAMLDMLAPFAAMTAVQWQQIYDQQQDIISYNYNLFRSGQLTKNFVQRSPDLSVNNSIKLFSSLKSKLAPAGAAWAVPYLADKIS